MIPRVLLALAVLLATHPTFVYAGHCNVQRVVKQQAVVQYVAPVVQHHAQQVVNYGHAYQQQVVLKQVGYVPQYYSVGAGVQEEALAERIARKALERINQQIEQATERIDRRGDDRSGFTHPGQTVAQHKCATCHVEGSAQVASGKAPRLFSGLGQFVGTPDQAVAAVDAAKTGRMPPKSATGENPPLDDDDYFALKAYLTEATSPIGK